MFGAAIIGLFIYFAIQDNLQNPKTDLSVNSYSNVLKNNGIAEARIRAEPPTKQLSRK